MNAVILILSDARGIYIPRDFVCDNYNEIATEHCDKWGIKQEDREILQNPEHDYYWGAWNEVLNYAKFTTKDGSIYNLYQDGDLWGICYEKMTDEEKQNFDFEY
ncbi:MAG: hypothetical protein ACKO96_20170 [Flammeovirgaceae bacterium]